MWCVYIVDWHIYFDDRDEFDPLLDFVVSRSLDRFTRKQNFSALPF
jgi:hypothetical protein